MKERVRRKPTPWDALIVAVCVLVGALCFVYGTAQTGETGGTAVVCIDGREVLRMDAAQPSEETVQANGFTLVVQTAPEGKTGVCICRADCPGNDCIHTGTITRGGEAIVCLPARVTVRLESASAQNVDAVTG